MEKETGCFQISSKQSSIPQTQKKGLGQSQPCRCSFPHGWQHTTTLKLEQIGRFRRWSHWLEQIRKAEMGITVTGVSALWGGCPGVGILPRGGQRKNWTPRGKGSKDPGEVTTGVYRGRNHPMRKCGVPRTGRPVN